MAKPKRKIRNVPPKQRRLAIRNWDSTPSTTRIVRGRTVNQPMRAGETIIDIRERNSSTVGRPRPAPRRRRGFM